MAERGGIGFRRSDNDPAAKAAGLLLRIGFALLVLVVPVVALFSRRLPLILVPIGALMIIIASAIMEETPDPREGLRRAFTSPAGLAAAFLAFWSTVSLAWTPFPLEAAERLFRVIGSIGLAVGAAVALPDRMRGSNLHLVGIGAAAGALASLVALVRFTFLDPIALERGATLVTLLAWPAVAWLTMKQRSLFAMALAALVGFAALVGRRPDIVVSLLAGAVVLGGAVANLRATARAIAVLMAGIMLLTPVAVLVVAPFMGMDTEAGRTANLWAQIITADYSRLITGYGLDTALRSRITNVLDFSAPRSLIFEIWYELGILGVVASALALAFGADHVGRLGPSVGPFALGCMAYAFALAVIGLGTAQTWWLTSLCVTAVAFAGVVNGQYRTVRPRATGLRPRP